jgi:hypothetical protein
MNLLRKLTNTQKKRMVTPDIYQNSIEKFGRNQLESLVKKGIEIKLAAV